MPKQKTIDLGNFETIDDTPQRNIVCRSWGWDKVGKNHFGFTMPGPIFGLYLDPGGTKGMIEKFIKGDGVAKREIFQKQYRFNKKFDDQEKAIDVRDQLIDDYHHALTVARSVQLDETEFWEVCRFAEFGRESAKGREFGPINGMYRGLIQDAFDANVNLQLIQKVKELWVNDKPTDQMKPDGFKQAGNIVQVSLEHTYEPDEDGNMGFYTRIVNARQNTAIWNMKQENMTFADLGVLVYPDSDREEWE